MDDLTPNSIIYVSSKCVGTFPCSHFVLIKYNSGDERKTLMDSISIYKLYVKLKQKPIPKHIKRNFYKTKIKNCIII